MKGEGNAICGLFPNSPGADDPPGAPDVGANKFAFAFITFGDVAGDACALLGDPPALPAANNALALDPDPNPPASNRSAVNCAKGFASAACANVGVPGAEWVGVALGLGWPMIPLPGSGGAGD